MFEKTSGILTRAMPVHHPSLPRACGDTQGGDQCGAVLSRECSQGGHGVGHQRRRAQAELHRVYGSGEAPHAAVRIHSQARLSRARRECPLYCLWYDVLSLLVSLELPANVPFVIVCDAACGLSSPTHAQVLMPLSSSAGMAPLLSLL